ncbi:unnamed protein product [Effrenium voratum]|uniref:Uncharacterized protein n=1 Tax=Effrenium voratum TaxID=2562239 RepID=A0AA36JSY9_9DINO|nr:unnamed protein product [Effrenium voratum]
MIFDGSLSSLLAAAPVESMRCPTKQQVQLAGDVLFRASAETDRVDVFIGHSWSAGRWQKFLALCLFFNLDLAVSCSLGTCGVAIAALLGSRGMTGLGGSSLAMPCLVYLPMTVFFAVFFFGQKLCERRSPSVWVDKLCIHQTDMGLKAEQIAALPVFVARSSRMLILWDETYFERLWCNLELATFSRHGGAEKVELLPLWLAPWLLFSILSDLLSATIFEVLEHVFPNWSVAWMDGIIGMAERVLGHNPAMLKFVVWFVIWMISSIVYLPASIPSFFSFRMKLRNHQLLLDQMAGFDVRKAKCTVPTDREAIEQQVKELFKEEHRPMSWLPPEGVDEGEVSLDNRLNRLWRMDPLDSFNAYIRGALRENVITQIGKELYVPWRTCLTAFLPMIFYSLVNVLGCDNGPCETSFKLAGFSSVRQYMIVQSIGWVLCIVLAFPLTYPTLLQMLKCALSSGCPGSVQLFLAFLCCPLAYVYCYICGSLIWASLVSLVQNYSPFQLLVFMLVMTLLVAQAGVFSFPLFLHLQGRHAFVSFHQSKATSSNPCQVMWLFIRNSHLKHLPSRCIRRQTYQEVNSGFLFDCA